MSGQPGRHTERADVQRARRVENMVEQLTNPLWPGLTESDWAEEAAALARDVLSLAAALRAAEAERDRLGRIHSCDYDTGKGQNCGKCQQCLLVHEYFLKEAVDRQQVALREAEEALRPFAEKWDLHAADYLTELVDGEEMRILPARVVAEMIEDINRARAALRASTGRDGAADGGEGT